MISRSFLCVKNVGWGKTVGTHLKKCSTDMAEEFDLTYLCRLHSNLPQFGGDEKSLVSKVISKFFNSKDLPQIV